MQSHTLNAIFSIAIAVLSTGALGQTVYKCGNTYSQVPCPGGVVVDVTDKRTSAQKAQTDLATGRDARTADAMEKARLQQEKIDLAANTPPTKAASADTASSISTSQAKKKKKAPEYSTVRTADEKKKKQAPKKSAVKKRSVKKDAAKS